MKLSRLYTNSPGLFTPIDFRPGLNVVLAEIRRPEHRKKDTHNLGKTALGRLLDFCLLAGAEPKFFLFKRLDLFNETVFFLEIELADAAYLTLRRGVKDAARVSFKQHGCRNQNFTELPATQWDHLDMPIDRAVDMLDGFLGWRALKAWSHRTVFHVRKLAGPHSEWDPLLAHILGIDDALMAEVCRLEELRQDKEAVGRC